MYVNTWLPAVTAEQVCVLLQTHCAGSTCIKLMCGIAHHLLTRVSMPGVEPSTCAGMPPPALPLFAGPCAGAQRPVVPVAPMHHCSPCPMHRLPPYFPAGSQRPD
jgi:hypothetical protein